MAKKKVSLQIDWKQLALQYGDKVGLCVAGLLALLLVVFGLTSSETLLSAQDIAKNKTDTQSAVQRFPVDPDRLEPAKLEPDRVKSVEQIAALSEYLKNPLPMGVLTTAFPWEYVAPIDDNLRSNPEALAVVALTAKPIILSYRAYEFREQGGNREVLVARPEKPIEIKTDASEKERRDRASGGRSGGSGGGPMGGGGMGGGGPIGGGGGMGGGGPLGGGGGRDRGRPGTGGAGSSGDQEGADASGNRWIGRFVPVKDAADDQWANHIWPVRAAYVVGIYPHAKQLELNSQALKEDKATVLPYYKRLEIQRRELVLKGTRLPDGSLAAEDLVVIDDGRGSISLQPVSSLPEITKDNEAHLAGWRMVDRTVISDRLRLAASDAFREPDSIVAGLLASCRLLVQRLPEPVRGEYPPIYNEIPQFKEMVEKIKKDKTVIPPPRRDPRLERGVDDAFGDEPPPPTDSGQQPAAGDTKEQEYVPEYGLVRFLDLELDAEAVGGRTFEYRVRVVLDNPNFERPHIVAVPESARIREVRGAWSPLVRVTFPSDTYIFADERQRRTTRPDIADTSDLDKVPLQVHAWLGRISTEGGAAAEERVGDWWVDRVLASRGEFIGRIPNAYLDRQRSRGNADTFEQRSGEASLIVWVPTVPSDPSNPTLFGLEMLSKVRTPNLMTRYVLVDFEGGARLNYRPPGSNTTFREDVPAEILVLDPSGRLFTRSLLADRDHPERKERFTRWDRWFKTVKEKSERNKPKDDQPRR